MTTRRENSFTLPQRAMLQAGEDQTRSCFASPGLPRGNSIQTRERRESLTALHADPLTHNLMSWSIGPFLLWSIGNASREHLPPRCYAALSQGEGYSTAVLSSLAGATSGFKDSWKKPSPSSDWQPAAEISA